MSVSENDESLLDKDSSRLTFRQFSEWLPFFKRLELIDQVWKSIYWPPNMGGTRDIPSNAVLHPSVKARMKSTATYRPDNQGFE